VVFVKVTPKVLVDGKEVGKIKNGESIFFETTPGEHEIQIKALTTVNYKVKLELHEGSIVKVVTDLVGWIVVATDSKS
jgi:hypothetical protein